MMWWVCDLGLSKLVVIFISDGHTNLQFSGKSTLRWACHLTPFTDSLLSHQWYVDGIGSCHCCEWHKSANDWRKALPEMKTLKSNGLLCSSEYLGNHIQSKCCDCGCSGSRNIGDSQLPVYVCVTRCV